MNSHITASSADAREYRRRLCLVLARDRSGCPQHGIPPIPARVVEWTRRWINTEPLEELLRWHFFGSACRGGGVCFERIDDSDERDDSVLVTEHSIRYYFRNYADRDLFGAWIEIDVDPPHNVVGRSPERKDSER